MANIFDRWSTKDASESPEKGKAKKRSLPIQTPSTTTTRGDLANNLETLKQMVVRKKIDSHKNLLARSLQSSVDSGTHVFCRPVTCAEVPAYADTNSADLGIPSTSQIDYIEQCLVTKGNGSVKWGNKRRRLQPVIDQIEDPLGTDLDSKEKLLTLQRIKGRISTNWDLLNSVEKSASSANVSPKDDLSTSSPTRGTWQHVVDTELMPFESDYLSDFLFHASQQHSAIEEMHVEPRACSSADTRTSQMTSADDTGIAFQVISLQRANAATVNVTPSRKLNQFVKKKAMNCSATAIGSAVSPEDESSSLTSSTAPEDVAILDIHTDEDDDFHDSNAEDADTETQLKDDHADYIISLVKSADRELKIAETIDAVVAAVNTYEPTPMQLTSSEQMLLFWCQRRFPEQHLCKATLISNLEKFLKAVDLLEIADKGRLNYLEDQITSLVQRQRVLYGDLLALVERKRKRLQRERQERAVNAFGPSRVTAHAGSSRALSTSLVRQTAAATRTQPITSQPKRVIVVQTGKSNQNRLAVLTSSTVNQLSPLIRRSYTTLKPRPFENGCLRTVSDPSKTSQLALLTDRLLLNQQRSLPSD